MTTWSDECGLGAKGRASVEAKMVKSRTSRRFSASFNHLLTMNKLKKLIVQNDPGLYKYMAPVHSSASKKENDSWILRLLWLITVCFYFQDLFNFLIDTDKCTREHAQDKIPAFKTLKI